MTGFGINSSYFMHSDPQYNKKHKEEISEYNAEYYENNKEKWKDNNKDSSKSGSDEDGKDSKDKKEKESSEDKVKALLKKLNGGSKKGGSSSSSKKSSSKSSSSSKKEETEEEKNKREEEEAKAKAETEEEKKKNSEAAEKYKATLEANAKLIEEQQKGKKKSKPNVAKSNKSVKHSAVYVGINFQPYFEHHGRLGMKWGKRNGPPYPLDYSKLSEEERAKDKARVKEEGDIESVGYKKNRSYFTDQEINEVINRYNLNTRINQLSAESAKMKAGKSKTDQMLEKLGKATEVGNKLANGLQAGTNVYNNVAKIMNALGDNELPIIGQAKQEKKKDWKVSKKELDKIIGGMDKNLDKYSNDDLKALNMRKAQYEALTKDRKAEDAKNKEQAETRAKAEQGVKDQEAKRDRDYQETVNRAQGAYRKVFNSMKNDTVEHVTGEVVDAGHDWFNENYLALEDKRRR